KYTVKSVADDLIEFIKKRYDQAFVSTPDKPILGFLIGGYSANEFFPSEYFYEFPVSSNWSIVRPDNPDGSPSFGANWYGMTDALTRLVKGFDPAALEELITRGADVNLIQQWVNDQVGELPLVFDGMPLQDAIDFAEYAVQV